jgi:hypothetical protein
MLKLYRRHNPARCQHTERTWRRCSCPLWADGSLSGKPTGLIAVSLGTVSCALFVTTHLRAESSVLLFGIAGLVVCVTLGLLWLFVIKPNWVRLAADAYAERLIGSLDGL